MRGKRIWVLAGLLSAGCAEYQGEVHPKVVQAADVDLVERLPEGFRLIGEVLAEASCERGGEDGLAEKLATEIECAHRRRLERRCRRLAAKNGGELLVGFECTVEFESFDAWDEEHGSYTRTDKTTTCSAEVARRTDRDD